MVFFLLCLKRGTRKKRLIRQKMCKEAIHENHNSFVSNAILGFFNGDSEFWTLYYIFSTRDKSSMLVEIDTIWNPEISWFLVLPDICTCMHGGRVSVIGQFKVLWSQVLKGMEVQAKAKANFQSRKCLIWSGSLTLVE